MEPVHFDDFRNDTASFDQLVLRTPQIDCFCSATDWILSARAAWTPRAEAWIRAGEAGYGAFLRIEDALGLRILHSFDTMWGFSCPLIGDDPARLVDEFVDASERDPDWQFIVVSGIKAESALYRAIVAAFRDRYATYECGRTRRWQASLRGGTEGYLARRSPKFRETLRASLRKAESLGIEVEPAFNPEPEAIDAVFRRILDIERASWKGSSETGLLMRDMEHFYRGLAVRVMQRGNLRALFARHDDRDIGYVLGGLMSDMYRGFQFSFDKRYGHLSLGNVMQFRQIEQLCEEGVTVYDLGIDMEYKRRWAETPVDTVSVAIMRL